MSAHEQYIGKKYGRWTVLNFSHRASGKRQMYICRCECGTIRPVSLAAIKHGHTISCGCLQREVAKKLGTKHGDIHKRLYKIWQNMRSRCQYPSARYYYMYGGAGITVCPEWENYETFRHWALTNGYDDNLSIDRIDGTKNYTPDNCRWVTMKQQQRNKRTNHKITLGNKTQSVTEWCEDLNISRSMVFKRLKLGWSEEKALLTPSTKQVK